MSREKLDELLVGTRTIAGTDWPVVDQLWRTGPRTWEIVRELCNGVPRGGETFRTETAAREAFGQRTEGRKPRAGAAATKRIAIRCTEAEHERWSAAAGGKALGEWLRDLADAATRAV